MTENLDRAATARKLREALDASEPSEAVRALVRAAIVGDIEVDEQDEQIIVAAIERLDTVQGDASRLVALAEDFARLLGDVSSSASALALLELTAGRERLVDIAVKHLSDVVSRTQFQSFVSAQRWPRELKSRIAELSRAELQQLVEALRERDMQETREPDKSQPLSCFTRRLGGRAAR